MKELENIFTAGTEALMRGRKIIYLPLNEDYTLVGKIIAYQESVAKLTLNKVWDTAGTPENFYAWARYENAAGSPPASEIIINSYIRFLRVGKGNNNFTSVLGYQLHLEASLDRASFVSFFVKP